MSQTGNKEAKAKTPIDREHRGNIQYRRAILLCLENLKDFQSKSNLDLVKRGTKSILEEQNVKWSEVVFVQTLRGLTDAIKQDQHIYAEFSSEFKIKRAQDLKKHRLETKRIFDVLARTKNEPVRKHEHDKWKIIPKKIYDRTRVVNAMDTH